MHHSGGGEINKNTSNNVSQTWISLLTHHFHLKMPVPSKEFDGCPSFIEGYCNILCLFELMALIK